MGWPLCGTTNSPFRAMQIHDPEDGQTPMVNGYHLKPVSMNSVKEGLIESTNLVDLVYTN